jgi:DNA-binding IclR family transcriptional regulator
MQDCGSPRQQRRTRIAVNSLERMIVILDLFEGQRLEWTMEEMQARLGYTRSTLYRYLKVLTDAGLLTSLPDVGYTLGPRIAELDYQMRERDPLISASRPVMAELVEEIAGIALLCRRYRDRVLCVHQEQGTASFHSNYERGLARPLLQGAASRIILAHMASPAVRKLYEADPAAVRDAGLGASLNELRAHLRTMRQTGWDATVSQVTRGVTGVAAPIFDRRDNVLGSLSVTIGEDHVSRERLEFIADRVVLCARIVTKTIARTGQAAPLPERPPRPDAEAPRGVKQETPS